MRLVPDCTLLADHALTGKAEKLSVLAERHLGLRLDKAEQTSDWSGELTEAQLRYAALDAAAVGALLPVLRERLAAEGGTRAYELMRDAQPAVVAMRLAGMPFDAAAQAALLARLTAERDRLAGGLGEALAGRNPNSGDQLSEWLAWALGGKGWRRLRGVAEDRHRQGAGDRRRRAEAGRGAAAGRQGAGRRASCCCRSRWSRSGSPPSATNLAAHVHPVTGRIHAHFRLAATVAGRMSCSRPNLQQVPRDREFRALFRAPEGRGSSSRTIRRSSCGWRRCSRARPGCSPPSARAGTRTRSPRGCCSASRRPRCTKAERQLAKAVNFGLLYGQGAKGLQAYAANSYGVEMTLDGGRRGTARRGSPPTRRSGAGTPRAAARARRALSVTHAGRARAALADADREDPACWKLTEALNTPVQGGAAEAMLAALGPDRRRSRPPAWTRCRSRSCTTR